MAGEDGRSRRLSDGPTRAATGSAFRAGVSAARAGAAIPAELAFEASSRSTGSLRALDGVSLTIEPGELVCLLGHSGCGKTTLLRVAAGVEAPTPGGS